MKKNTSLLFLLFITLSHSLKAQESVDIDGRLQPLLNDFFEQCKKYNIDYHSKLFELEKIDIVQTLPLAENGTVLGKVERNAAGEAQNILINWAALLDPEILKVVAFHEFAHHFLDYKHTCQDCNEIMAVTNTSYFDIARDWDNQVEHLFISSPLYMAQNTSAHVTSLSFD
ncbi:hypothetical protein GGR42_002179 [Saonia flava]|uniref:Uncharacterized protein n=1 Tax=Saonia flava TaxID=523696 RepID=A0A846QWW0_9FLAO|nr:hypothetical protein [Saonia flava]NJB71717.1 hypothetical protein [Saonia flava]